MAADRLPSTPALRLLRQHRVEAQCHQYAYAANGGAAEAAALGIELHDMIKTLVFERDDRQPFPILMHGDREVSTKRLARSIGVKRVPPVHPGHGDAAQRLSGGRHVPFRNAETHAGLRGTQRVVLAQDLCQWRQPGPDS